MERFRALKIEADRGFEKADYVSCHATYVMFRSGDCLQVEFKA